MEQAEFEMSLEKQRIFQRMKMQERVVQMVGRA